MGREAMQEKTNLCKQDKFRWYKYEHAKCKLARVCNKGAEYAKTEPLDKQQSVRDEKVSQVVLWLNTPRWNPSISNSQYGSPR